MYCPKSHFPQLTQCSLHTVSDTLTFSHVYGPGAAPAGSLSSVDMSPLKLVVYPRAFHSASTMSPSILSKSTFSPSGAHFVSLMWRILGLPPGVKSAIWVRRELLLFLQDLLRVACLEPWPRNGFPCTSALCCHSRSRTLWRLCWNLRRRYTVHVWRPNFFRLVSSRPYSNRSLYRIQLSCSKKSEEWRPADPICRL